MRKIQLFTVITILLFSTGVLYAQNKRTYAPLDKSVPTENTINSKIGKLEFPLGYPTNKTAQMLEDEMLYINAVNAYTNTIQGASLWALRKGFAQLGVNDGDFIVYTNPLLPPKWGLSRNVPTSFFPRLLPPYRAFARSETSILIIYPTTGDFGRWQL